LKNNKKVLIIGGAGFFGYHLLIKLLKYNYIIDIIDNFEKTKKIQDVAINELLKNRKVKLIKLDISKNLSLKKFSKNYDFIFNFAAILGVENVINNSFQVLKKNFQIHINSLNILKINKNAHYFYTSTSEIYAGSLEKKLLKFPTKESNLLVLQDLNNKRSSYMLSKIYCEALCNHFKGNITILRPHNIYGPRMGTSHVIPQIFKKFFSNKKNLVAYSPNHKRTFCYINDFIEFIFILMNRRDRKRFDTFNIGNPNEEILIKKLVLKIGKILNSKKKIIWKNDNHDSPKKRKPSIIKLINITKYKPKFNLEKGLELTLEWYKKHE
jgi:UDP-glucose 4-epimerase